MGLISDLGSGILGGLASIFQSKINAQIAKSNTDQTILANKQMAEYAFNKDLEMWNKQNEYNSPEAQMERFKAAGLNPNLVYQQGNSGNASSMAHYNAPTMEYNYKPVVDIPLAIGLYNDLRLKQGQTNNLKAQEEGKNIENAIKAIDLDWKPANAEINWMRNVKGLDIQRVQYNINKTKLNLAQQILNSQVNKFQAEAKKALIDTQRSELEYKLRKIFGWASPIVNAVKVVK